MYCSSGGVLDGSPSREVGKPSIPRLVIDLLAQDLERYLAAHPKADNDSLFITPTGTPIDETNFYKRHWFPMLER
ncbi:MAG: hypothetical protein ACHQ9S_23220 [Candidatus Binatia bacterium]